MRKAILTVFLCAGLFGCAAPRVKFRTVQAPGLDRSAAFAAAKQVMLHYFDEFEVTNPKDGIISALNSRLIYGPRPKDRYKLWGVVMVEEGPNGAIVRYKVSRTKLKSGWSWFGFGTNYREWEVAAGPDKRLMEQLGKDLAQALKAQASKEKSEAEKQASPAASKAGSSTEATK